jgi:hypothetical protein
MRVTSMRINVGTLHDTRSDTDFDWKSVADLGDTDMV